MIAALAKGPSHLTNLSPGDDVAATRRCLELCGIKIENAKGGVVVHGRGGQFDDPTEDLNAANSGTTARLLTGLLAGRGIKARLVGDESLSRRPMGRVVDPLRTMGAQFIISPRGTLPLTIHPAKLKSLKYTMPVPSAQVKSSLLLAGLASEGAVTVNEPIPTRNHTENLFKSLGVKINVAGNRITVGAGIQKVSTFDMRIPGDLSSAANLAALAVMLPNVKLTFSNQLLNPTRLGFFQALESMGVTVTTSVEQEIMGEPVGSLSVQSSPLKGVKLKAPFIPKIIDEIPVLAILATQAKGDTVVQGAQELRLKESDRIKAICENLRRMGARVEELPDGFRILGPTSLKGGKIITYKDHRIAMAFSVASKLADGTTVLDNPDCVRISFPAFHEYVARIMK